MVNMYLICAISMNNLEYKAEISYHKAFLTGKFTEICGYQERATCQAGIDFQANEHVSL